MYRRGCVTLSPQSARATDQALPLAARTRLTLFARRLNRGGRGMLFFRSTRAHAGRRSPAIERVHAAYHDREVGLAAINGGSGDAAELQRYTLTHRPEYPGSQRGRRESEQAAAISVCATPGFVPVGSDRRVLACGRALADRLV